MRYDIVKLSKSPCFLLLSKNIPITKNRVFLLNVYFNFRWFDFKKPV